MTTESIQNGSCNILEIYTYYSLTPRYNNLIKCLLLTLLRNASATVPPVFTKTTDRVTCISWICALTIELATAQEMLDEEHEGFDHDISLHTRPYRYRQPS